VVRISFRRPWGYGSGPARHYVEDGMDDGPKKSSGDRPLARREHTLITELAEGGAGDQTIMDIAGHVSRQMLARYSHIRTETKRNALEEVLKRRQETRALGLKNKKAEEPKSVPAVN
jgi:integrase